jgi:hypothetical protein
MSAEEPKGQGEHATYAAYVQLCQQLGREIDRLIHEPKILPSDIKRVSKLYDLYSTAEIRLIEPTLDQHRIATIRRNFDAITKRIHMLDDIVIYRVSRSRHLSEGVPHVRIAQPAGSVLVILAKWLLNDAAYRDIIEPAIIDMRNDVFDALKAGQPNRAKWFVFCGYCRILYPLAAGIIKTVFAFWRKSGA